MNYRRGPDQASEHAYRIAEKNALIAKKDAEIAALRSRLEEREGQLNNVREDAHKAAIRPSAARATKS